MRKIAAFSMPEGWEDWATLVIGLWLFASPWTLQVDDSDAAANFLAVGALVITLKLITFYTLRVWEEWINIALGAWLIITSLPMSGFAIAANAVVCDAAYSCSFVTVDQCWHSVHGTGGFCMANNTYRPSSPAKYPTRRQYQR